MTTPRGIDKRLRTIRDVFVIAVVFVFVNRAFIIGGEAYPLHGMSDMLQLSRPVLTYSGKALLDGEMPLWNPNMAAGYPNHAMGCAGVFYPTTWIYGCLDFPRACVWDMMLHHFLAVVCAYSLGRVAAKSRLAAVGLALITMRAYFFHPSVISMGHIWTERTLSWTPLVLLCLWRLIDSPKAGDAGDRGPSRPTGHSHRGVFPEARYLLGLSIALGVQMLAGDLQILLCQGYVMALFAVAMLLTRVAGGIDNGRTALRKILLCAGAAALAVGIGAVQWAPTWELMGESTRNRGVSLDYVRSFSAILNIPLLPTVWLVLQWTFPSVVAAALFLAGLFSQEERYRWAFIFTFVVVSLLALWPDTFLAPWLHRVALLGESREPERILQPAFFLVHVLVFRQFDRWFVPLRHPKGVRLGWTALEIILFLPVAWVLTGATLCDTALAAGILLACLIGATVFRERSRARLAAAVLACSAMAGEYLWQEPPNVVALMQPLTSPARKDGYHPVPPMYYDLHANLRRFLASVEPFERVAVFSGLFHEGNTSAGSMTGNRMLASYHAVQLDSFTEWFNDITGVPLTLRTPEGRLDLDCYDVWADPEWVTPAAFPVLDLLNIRYLIAIYDPIHTIEEDAASFSERFRQIEARSLMVYENMSAMPPAFLLHHALPAQSLADVVEHLRDPAFDYSRTALVPLDVPIEALKPTRRREEVGIARYGRNSVDLNVSIDTPGVLVLTDVYYPGWRAKINDVETTVFPVDGILKGLLVPAGTHSVRLEFSPRTYRVGYAVSAMCLSLALVGVIACCLTRCFRPRFLADHDKAVVSVERQVFKDAD